MEWKMSTIGGLRTRGIKKSSKEQTPLISIITVVYNGEKHLEQTIKSVLSQTYENIEYIIIDGGSTDGTLNIVKKYEDRIDYWISEPDDGIADAFNKGIKQAQGEWIGIINADDWYEPYCCEVVSQVKEANFIFGTIRYWDEERSFIDRAKPEIIYEDMRINHPTLFVRKKLYEAVGLYNTTYKIAMDYDLVLRLFERGEKYENIERVLANMRIEGVSQQFWVEAKKEAKSIKIKYGVPRYKAESYLMIIRSKRFLLQLLERYNLQIIHQIYRTILHKG